MKICLIADQHGNLPDLPESDICLIAGDICPIKNHDIYFQSSWLNTNFKDWANSIKTKYLVYVAGNHDFVFQKSPKLIDFHKINGTYLQDSSVEILGQKIYGSPWQPTFFDWAFNAEEPFLKERWEAIPDDTNILLLHGPPYGFGDTVQDDKTKEFKQTGSPSLTERILELKSLKLAVAGHIHAGRGGYDIGNTQFYNATLLDEKYKLIYEPYLINL